MSVLRIPESTIAQSIRALTASHLDPDRLERDGILDRFARATWTVLAEPGDSVAGRLVAGLGASAALRAVLDAEDGASLGVALRAEAAGDGVDSLESASRARDDEHLSPATLDDALKRWRPRIDSAAALRSLTQAERFAVSLVVPGDPLWPESLADLGHAAPHALWVRGRPEVLAALPRSIAIVGARAATGYGEHVAVEAASGLVDRGHAIVSGAAYGIDGAAHRAALASRGETIAVLAGGLDRYYPSGHEALLSRIAESGAVVGEVPCGTAPTRWRFLQRNRIIAALSRATVVIEAGARSGSLNTAGHAAQLGRPLGAVPGPVTSSASAGCHRLLREYDAICVTSAEEMAELAPLPEPVAGPQDETGAIDEGMVRSGADSPGEARSASGASSGTRGTLSDGARVRLLDALSTRSARTPSALAASSGLAPDRVRAELGLLELEGIVRPRGQGWVKGR